MLEKRATSSSCWTSCANRPFPDDESPDLDDAEYLVTHVGKLGYLQLGFAHQGVMFIFKTATDWYDRFPEPDGDSDGTGRIVVDDPDDE